MSDDIEGLDEEEDTSILGQIEASVKMEGHKPGTEAFATRRLQLQVAKCREMRGYSTCTECPAADFCELYIGLKREAQGIK